MGGERGAQFNKLQRETYERLYSDLDFALYKVDHPFRYYFEHRLVSFASAAGLQETRLEELGSLFPMRGWNSRYDHLGQCRQSACGRGHAGRQTKRSFVLLADGC